MRAHVTVYRWVQRFTAEFISAARPRRHVPGDRWFVDQTHVKVAGRWTFLCAHTFVQNLRRGHYEITPICQLDTASAPRSIELALAI